MARAWLYDVLHRYHYRPEAVDAILAHCDVEVRDWGSGDDGALSILTALAIGDGVIHGAARSRGARSGACLVYAKPRRRFGDALVNMMLSQSDRVALPHWQPFRRLMNVYRYGQGDWPGMWVQSANRWNHDEIWAGGASFSMGDLRQYPVMARRLYERMFEPANWTLLPLVMR